MKLQELLESGAAAARKPSWPPGHRVYLPHRFADGSDTGVYTLEIDGERAMFARDDIDDGGDDWEGPPPVSAESPDFEPPGGGDPGRYVLRFGRHSGRTLDDIASTDDGLLYLDGLAGKSWLFPATRDALGRYLGQPCIAREIENLMGG